MRRGRDFGKRAPRVDLRRRAVLINSDGVESDVIILDVSRGGFRLEIAEVLAHGECVRLRVERGQEFSAQILWTMGNEAGGVFAEPIDPAELA
jgi:hypothetical protein